MSILGPILGLVGVGGIGAALVFVPGLAAAAAKLASAAVSFIVNLPWAKIWWIVPCLAFFLFGLWQLHGRHVAEAKLPACEKRAADSHQAFLLEKKAFAAEKASLDGARSQIDDTNKRILAQAADLEQAKRDAAAADARNASLAKSTDAKISALQQAALHHTAPCTLSDEARKELENQ